MDRPLLLTGGRVVDGTGAPAIRADVLVHRGRVAAIAPKLADVADAISRDVTGLVVCPGFVDIHTHSDLTLLSSPLAISKIQQGVTTEVVGNCGLGTAPLVAGQDRVAVRQAVSYLDRDPAVSWEWDSVRGYGDAVTAARPSVNVGILVGHLPLHTAVMGFADRTPSAVELGLMAALLDQTFDEGALGVSTGLAYAPLTTVGEAELIMLAEGCARRDRVFSWHVRNYGRGLEESVDQVLRIAELTGCRMQLSHLQAVGRRNWGQLDRVLARVTQARDDGLRVGIDIYPYLHGNAPLAQRLPSWAQAGTVTEWMARLRDGEVRRKVLLEWEDLDVGWDETSISAGPPSMPSSVMRRPVTEVVAELGQSPAEWALDLLADHGTAVMMVAGGRSEAALRTVLSHPATVVASDGMAMDPDGPTADGAPHPRSFGCFPRYLSRYRPSGPHGLAEAIARCTSRPADLMGLDRGRLHDDAVADIVVFDPERIRDGADFVDPCTPPEGVVLVIVDGHLVIDHGRHTGARPGRLLLH